MVKIGYSLSSEEFGPNDLVKCAKLAQDAGFEFAMISDHFHPWTNSEPNSPFVWSVLGALAHATDRLQLGTGVTCPLIRIHPAIVAQAVATVATMTLGRFFLGVGTGEYLNEHITAEKWPTPAQRLEMLEEAIEIMRNLWRGGWHSHEGLHYTVQHARIFTLPEKPPAIMMAAAKPRAAELAGRVADGLISFEPDAGIVKSFEAAGGEDKPRYGQLTVSFGADEAESAKAVHRYWPNAGVGGRLMTDLELPHHFEEVIALTNPEKTIEGVPCGPDPRRHIEGIERYIDAGYDHVYIHQVGPRQEEFIRFYSEQVLPHFNKHAKTSNGSKRNARNGDPAKVRQRHSSARQV
jgi:coenzyme F420-dependent glucose-6-phosphate dehydrogenase